MRDMQLIYASRPFGYDDLTLTSILMQARENNARNGITGALICREDVFLQILEGPRDLVTSTFSRILRDERHVDVVNLLSSEIDRRLFPEWSMRHDPAQSWMWTPEEVARGAIGRASDQEIRGIFERLARQPARSNGQLVDRSGSEIEKPGRYRQQFGERHSTLSDLPEGPERPADSIKERNNAYPRVRVPQDRARRFYSDQGR